MTKEARRALHVALRDQLPDVGRRNDNAIYLHIVDTIIADTGLLALLGHACGIALALVAKAIVAPGDNPLRAKLADQHFMDEVAPVHVLHALVKVAEDDLVHPAQLFDLLAAVSVGRQQRHLPPQHDRIRMHVEREHRTRAANLAGALDRALHQRLMPQMHTVKIAQRNRARLLIFLHRVSPFPSPPIGRPFLYRKFL